LIGLVAALFAILVAGGAIVLFSGFGYGSTDDSAGVTTQRIGRGRLLVTVTEDGNLESAKNVEVRCQVAGGGTIIWIIADGSMVEEGQELVRLDQSVIEDQLNTQKINYEKARATKIQADEDYAAACISVKEYDEGTYLKDLQAAESQIKIAMENLRSAENTDTHTERMFRKGFVTALQLEADKFAVERAKLDLDAAQTSKKVLQDFTRPKTLKGLQATRDAAEARTRSEQAALNLEKDKLDRLQNQLKFSVIKAPQHGMVIYANEMSGRSRGFGGNQNSTIEEGAVVRERQTLIRLPDLSKMQVKVTVHESKVELIHPGMPARITVQDRQWVGKVISVANQPEPGSFFSASVKEYATIVSIEGDTTGLRPGMTADVEILISDLRDVLTVPVSAVVEQGGKFSTWVRDNSRLQRRPLLLGQTNDKVMEVKDGLKEGDEVILNPRAVIAEAQHGSADAGDLENADRFGKSAAAAAKSTGDAAGKPRPADSGADAKQDRPRRDREQGARNDSAKADGSKRSGEGKRRGGGGRNRPQLNMAQFDKNKDGKLTPDELPEQMQGFFDRLDTDHDGAITQKELDEARKRMEARRRQQQGDSPQGGPGGPGAGGPP